MDINYLPSSPIGDMLVFLIDIKNTSSIYHPRWQPENVGICFFKTIIIHSIQIINTNTRQPIYDLSPKTVKRDINYMRFRLGMLYVDFILQTTHLYNTVSHR